MRIKLRPDKDLRVQKTRIGRVPALVLRPANQTDYTQLPPCYTFVGDGEPFYAETLAYVDNLKAAGVEAEVDVYHTDMHAFDMLRDDDLSREAIKRFERHFEEALEKYC